MDGASLKAGAVAAVERVRNPVRLARLVQERSEHMMLVGAGAEKFAAENGMPLCAPEELVTERARAAWREYLEKLQMQAVDETSVREGSTVGAVAMDARGSLFAGTSTGGTRFKYPGRVGDSPLIGCGCYADAGAGGVSCTGHGEGIMKIVMGKAAVDLLRERRVRANAENSAIAQGVAEAVVRRLAERTGSTGGLILLDSEGNPAAAFNTPRMAYGYVEAGGSFRIAP